MNNNILATRHLQLTRSARFKNSCWAYTFHVRAGAKRWLDIVIATIALLVLSPLLVLVAVLIKFDSKGTVLFKQTRIGQAGRPFKMLKFRSMVSDAEVKRQALQADNEMSNGVLFKIKRDPRITRIGAFIRQTSIDELPQLLNVLKGEMSLVGPRPALPNEVHKYKHTDFRRLQALPGITCEWQVAGRSNIPFEQQVELDAHYIQNQSLGLDLLLLLKTIPAVLTARGAY